MVVTFRTLDLKQPDDLNTLGRFCCRELERLGRGPKMLDTDRLDHCSDAIVAEEDGAIVGFVTLAPEGVGRVTLPTVDGLYVRDDCRLKGLGTTLFQRGIRRLIDLGAAGEIYCDLHNSIMLRLVAKLPPELRERLAIRHSYRSGDLAEDLDPAEDLPP